MSRIRVKKGDEVMIVAGAEKGKTGRVMQVIQSKGKVIVEGGNVRKRAYKRGANPNYPDGGIHEKEMPIQASNVMILDPESGAPTRIGVRIELDANGKRKRIRFAKGSGKTLPEQY